MVYQKFVYSFLLSISLFSVSFAQNKFDNYQFISIKEGTSKRAVSTIVQDNYGFMWIGTNGGGLFKYDGINYKGYKYNPKNTSSINSNLIYISYVDRNNKLWIGTDEGLCLYNRDLDKFISIDLKNAFLKGYKEPISIKSITEDDFGNLWLGTYGYGLFKLDLKTLKVSLIKSKLTARDNFQISFLAKNKTGKVYLGTNYGLLELDSSGIIRQVYKDKFKKEPLTEAIESLLVDSNGFIWIGTTSSGLLKLFIDTNNYQYKAFDFTKNKIFSIIQNDGYIFCATENNGLFLLNRNGEVLQQYLQSKYDDYSLKSNSIWSLFLDKQNKIWLGYYNKGLGLFDKINNKFNALEYLLNNDNSLQTSSVTGVAKDNSGKVFITTEGGGLDIFNPADRSYIHVNSRSQGHYSGLNASDIQTIFIDSKQNIWLGSWNTGIYFLKYGTKNFVNYNVSNSGIKSNKVFSFAEDSKGKIWIGTFIKGLHYYDPAQNKFFHCNSKPFVNSGLAIALIRKVLVDSDNFLWVGTISGLYQVKMNNDNSFTVLSMKNEILKNVKKHNNVQTILSIYESNDKTIWIGTDGGGLFSYDKKIKKYTNYNDFKGFTEKSVSGIISSLDQSVWVSGGSGITKLDLKNKVATNFTTDDGLLVNDFNNNAVFRDNNDVLYFGSYEGLTYFNPSQITKNKKEIPLYLTDLKLFNKSVVPDVNDSPLTKVLSETQTVELNHNQSVFTIEYVAINYSYPKKNEYAYYLEGFEDKWNYVGSKNSATYTNLEPGEYVFKLKSSDKGGLWNKQPLQLHIKILPPWWRTNFAYFIYLLSFGVFIFYLNKFLKKRLEEKESIKFERQKASQVEKLNDKKLQFFTNISHEFRTPLTLIINPLEDILKNKELPAEVLDKLKVVHKSSDRLSRLINELMDFRKLQFNKVSLQVQQFDIVSFTKDIVNYFTVEASYRNIDLEFQSNQETLFDWVDPKMFEKIIFNIISNAFKFSPDNGSIKVSIDTENNLDWLPLIDTEKKVASFKICIEDKGAGLEKKEVKKIFDRFYQVNNLNKAYYGSTGIGLEVVKGFVELHKGKIEVESELGVGTKFILTFPLGKHFYDANQIGVNEKVNSFLDKATIETTALPEKPIIKQVKTLEKNTEKKYTILIVEDNAELRNYLKNELISTYKVIVADNGKTGYDLAIQKLPDLIVTDVIMPVMDGIEFCKKIKTNAKTSHIPLLMLSAKAYTKDKIEGIDSGADMYLSKPFEMDILRSSLTQLITSRQILYNKFYTGITNSSVEKTTATDNEFIQRMLSFIVDNLTESDLTVEFLADKMFLSRSQLYRKLKKLTGVSVNEFIRNVRLEKASQLIELGNNNINEISYKVGFTSSSYFAKCYKVKYGILPTQSKEL